MQLNIEEKQNGKKKKILVFLETLYEMNQKKSDSTGIETKDKL